MQNVSVKLQYLHNKNNNTRVTNDGKLHTFHKSVKLPESTSQTQFKFNLSPANHPKYKDTEFTKMLNRKKNKQKNHAHTKNVTRWCLAILFDMTEKQLISIDQYS